MKLSFENENHHLGGFAFVHVPTRVKITAEDVTEEWDGFFDS